MVVEEMAMVAMVDRMRQTEHYMSGKGWEYLFCSMYDGIIGALTNVECDVEIVVNMPIYPRLRRLKCVVAIVDTYEESYVVVRSVQEFENEMCRIMEVEG